jgi:hypothetical protein
MTPVSPAPTVEDLLAAVRRGGAEAHEAALALGLLIEDRPPDDNAGVAAVVGGDLAARRLSPTELNAAVDGLISCLQDTDEPHPMAVWALTKSYEPHAVPALIALLDRRIDDPRAVPLVYQALVGVLTTGLTMPEYREQSLAAVRRAAARGHAEVAETAQRYLRTAPREEG